MESIIKQIYNSEIEPIYTYLNQCQELQEIRRKHYSQYEDFLSRLDPNMADEFERIMDSQIETLPIEYSETFKEGFQLGALLIMEIFSSKHLQSTEK